MNNSLDKEKNFTSALITALSSQDHVPDRSEVEEKAQQMSLLFRYQGSLEAVIEEVLIAMDTRMGSGVSLVDINAKHDEEWVFKRDIAWIYSEAYEKYLKQQKWHPTVVQSLSDVSKKILGHLQDPHSEGSWDRRGLVIGHVQSGKTANYIGLVSRAADAGYRFIIVIAGIHNNLRKQTQERIDEGFVGRSSDPKARRTIGVGITERDYPHPATLTNIHKDFNKHTADQSGWSINDFSKPIILVIKKNVSTLNSLQRWLRELNTKGNGKISDVPMLMIDDEADNASINTNREDIDPTRTNSMIRKILEMFDKSCYVGYTATPFANIFINPDAYDEGVREELFPKDFIYCLDAPTTYFGPGKVFLEDEDSGVILREITDAENYIPYSLKKYDQITELPPSLYRTVQEFILARTIRNLRGQEKKHCSMMINVSRLVSIQNQVRNFISSYLKKMKDAVKANYKMPCDIASRNKYMIDLERVFNEEFCECGFSWITVKEKLFDTFKYLHLLVVNSKSDETLDYRKYEVDGVGLTAIAVGGLSLSRGITLEGLCVSYMYRNTRMYDTLMQMGRWFGYRPHYEDLCRIHLSRDSINWYAHISDASEGLRQQIKQMRKDRLSPKDFGLYVQAHPDRLLVTAKNKMRSGEQITVKQNFSGIIKESYILPSNEEINHSNRLLIEKYWKMGFGRSRNEIKETEKGWYVLDVDSRLVEEFLLSFRVHKDFVDQRNAHAKYLNSISEKHSVCDIVLISKNNHQPQVPFRLGAQNRESATLEGDRWKTSGYRVASKTDEKFGLTPAQLQRAKELAKEGSDGISDHVYRSVREKPLLMLHFLDLGKNHQKQINVPAYGISFPFGDYSVEIEVVANKIWVDQVHGDTSDMPDAEEDYDD